MKTFMFIFVVLGLIGVASVGTAQEKSDKKGTQWQGSILCSRGQGKGKFSLNLYDDSTYGGKWEVNCLGARVFDSGGGTYKIEESKINFVASGSADSDIGGSSGYSLTFSGNIVDTTGSGTWQISFEEAEWPRGIKGTWEVVKLN